MNLIDKKNYDIGLVKRKRRLFSLIFHIFLQKQIVITF